MSYRRILAALDGSRHAEAVLSSAVEQARLNEAELLLATAVPHYGDGAPILVADIGGQAQRDREALQVEAREAGKALLAKAQARATEAGLDPRSLLLEGEAADVLCRCAAEHEVELLVIGSRGLSTVKELLLGSVSHKVAQLAPCPVLIVK